MNGLHVNGNFYMAKGAEIAETDLTAAIIEGELAIIGAKLTGLLNMNGLRVEESLVIREGSQFKDIDLTTAKVGGQLELTNAKINSVLKMNGIRIEQNILIREGTVLAELELKRAKVGGALNFQKAVIQNSINLRGCSVEFFLDSDNWPTTYYLNGFHYRHLEHKVATQSSEWFENWLKNQAEFSFASYELPSRLLEDFGDKDKADTIRFKGKEEQRRRAVGFGQKVFLWFHRWLIGYGFRMWYPLIYIGSATLLGTIILEGFYCPGDEKLCTNLESVFFSLDTLLPIINLNPIYEEMITNLSPSWIKYSFYVIELFGWLLGSFLIIGLSGLTKK